MFNKLSFRIVQRSAKDYLVYMLTMTAITAFMYAFSSLFFDKELSGSFEMAGIMQVMIGIATFFIVMIVAWLINYWCASYWKSEVPSLEFICFLE